MNKVVRFGILTLASLLVGCAHSNSQDISNVDPSKITNAKALAVSANSHYAAGQLAEAQGQTDNAINQYTITLKADPKNQGALYRLGVLYTQLKRFNDAIDCWQRYIKVTDNAAEAYNNLAYTYELSGDQASAADAYQKGIAIDPKNVACRTNYGLLLTRQDHSLEAMRIWQPVLSDAEIHYNLASCYEEQGRKLEARLEFKKAVELDPKFQDAKERLAELPMD
jgi:tetratricopeptide (TPR) repeat protein